MRHTETVKNLYAAIRARDWGRFKTLTQANLEWIQNRGFPNGKHSRGPDEVIKNVFEVFARDWQGWGFEPNEFIEAGNKVVVLGAYSGTHKITGKSFSAAAAHVFEIKAGKVLRFRQFTDTAEVVTATI